MGIFKGLAKIALSPLNGVAEIVKDVSGSNGNDAQEESILTLGVFSAIKGTGKGFIAGISEIFDD